MNIQIQIIIHIFKRRNELVEMVQQKHFQFLVLSWLILFNLGYVLTWIAEALIKIPVCTLRRFVSLKLLEKYCFDLKFYTFSVRLSRFQSFGIKVRFGVEVLPDSTFLVVEARSLLLLSRTRSFSTRQIFSLTPKHCSFHS